MYLQFTYWYRGSEISSAERVASLVVVAHTLFFYEVKLVWSEILRVGEQFCHVHLPESVGQSVVFHIPVVDKLSGVVFPRSVFAISAQRESDGRG